MVVDGFEPWRGPIKADGFQRRAADVACPGNDPGRAAEKPLRQPPSDGVIGRMGLQGVELPDSSNSLGGPRWALDGTLDGTSTSTLSCRSLGDQPWSVLAANHAINPRIIPHISPGKNTPGGEVPSRSSSLVHRTLIMASASLAALSPSLGVKSHGFTSLGPPARRCPKPPKRKGDTSWGGMRRHRGGGTMQPPSAQRPKWASGRGMQHIRMPQRVKQQRAGKALGAPPPPSGLVLMQ